MHGDNCHQETRSSTNNTNLTEVHRTVQLRFFLLVATLSGFLFHV